MTKLCLSDRLSQRLSLETTDTCDDSIQVNLQQQKQTNLLSVGLFKVTPILMSALYFF